MQIQAISPLNFEGKSNKTNKKRNSNPQQPHYDIPKSNQGSKAMRDLMIGLMALGATSGTLASCDRYDDELYASASASASSSASASAVVIGGHCHHHDTVTIIKPDTIYLPGDTIYLPGDTIITPPDTVVVNDTIINTEIKPVYVKDYPFHLGDSLIAQGENIGVKVDGPGSNEENAVYVGSKAHNRYDNKFYESMVDSVGTNKRELSIVTKVLDMYDFKNPKTSYMKTVVTDVPGRGIKLTRYVANTDKKPEDDEQYLYNYAGYEVRSNGRDGRQNTRSIFDNNNNLIYKGNYERGEDLGTFLYGSIICDENGNPYYDEDGNVEFAQYDFDQAVIYSDYAKKSEDFEYPGWKYE